MDKENERTYIPDREKMEALARLSGRIAHDLNNMLGAIEGYATLAASTMKEDDPVKADMGEIRLAVAKAAALTKQLLIFARRRALRREPCDVGALLAGAARKASGDAWKGIKIESRIQPGLPAISADAEFLERALLDLLDNARETMPGGGTVTLSAQPVRLPPGGAAPAEAGGEFVKVSVGDTGPGIPEELLPRIFEPFVPAGPKGNEPGLRLSMVYGIVAQHDGWVEVQGGPGRGSEFSLYLPAAGGPPSAAGGKP